MLCFLRTAVLLPSPGVRVAVCGSLYVCPLSFLYAQGIRFYDIKKEH
jgi:hypothetical protein